MLIDGISYPDPLQKNDGGMVATVAEWENVRRAELLQHFRDQIYGHPLPAPTTMRFAVTAADFASVTRKTVTITGSHGRGLQGPTVHPPRHYGPSRCVPS